MKLLAIDFISYVYMDRQLHVFANPKLILFDLFIVRWIIANKKYSASLVEWGIMIIALIFTTVKQNIHW
jgi:hypothetical protein